MFLSDERWGSEFWSPELVAIDEDLELMMIMHRALQGMESYEMNQIKDMAIERGIPVTTLHQMRAEIARVEAKKQLAIEQGVRKAAAANRKKEELLMQNNGR